MAGQITITPANDWTAEIQKTLTNALNLSMDVMGRTGEEACKHGMIMMAKSARALAMKSKKNRQVMDSGKPLGKYVEVYNQGQTAPTKLYQWACGTGNLKDVTWEKAKAIKNQGLAKRSWMWGLKAVGAQDTGRAIPGTSRFYSITGEKVNGYIKVNKLAYIIKAMPAGWESAVQTAVTNKIFKQAALKMERQWRSAVGKIERATAKPIRDWFIKAAS